MRKHGLANLYAFLMRARDDRKVTPGITELSRLRVHMGNLLLKNKSTARFATSMSALPILAVQK